VPVFVISDLAQSENLAGSATLAQDFAAGTIHEGDVLVMVFAAQ
jgi:hypothetical protein